MPVLLKKVRTEMVVRVLALVSPTEGSLQSEAIGDAELLPDDNTCCAFFRFLHSKVAISEIENVAVLVEETWEDLFLEPIVNFARVTIHKDVLLAGVAVDITRKEHITVLLELLNHL
jgi:hypothetical protein